MSNADPKNKLDAFEPPDKWTSTALSLGPRGSFGIDTHMYQTIVAADAKMSQNEHISAPCTRGAALQSANGKAPVYVGEWTATTNACINPDGTSKAQHSHGKCCTEGCVCVTGDVKKYTNTTIQDIRKFVEAQLWSHEKYSSGYFLWSWIDPEVDMGSWSIVTGVEMGWFPKNLGDMGERMYTVRGYVDEEVGLYLCEEVFNHVCEWMQHWCSIPPFLYIPS